MTELQLLKSYYYERVKTETMPEWEQLSADRIRYIRESICFALFRNSKRAIELELELMALLN